MAHVRAAERVQRDAERAARGRIVRLEGQRDAEGARRVLEAAPLPVALGEVEDGRGAGPPQRRALRQALEAIVLKVNQLRLTQGGETDGAEEDREEELDRDLDEQAVVPLDLKQTIMDEVDKVLPPGRKVVKDKIKDGARAEKTS